MKQRHTPKTVPVNPKKTSGEDKRPSQPARQTEQVDNPGVHRGQNAEKGDSERPEDIESAKYKRQDGVHH